ncbi:MAG: polysulfide reductase NrfD [Peptococcaceae bacterium]|nr:polysulfide reductase NrfD [Peptococcaceae bacterium]
MKEWVFKSPTGRWNLRLTPIRLGMLAFIAFSLVMILARYYAGLGYWTNLSDAVPWGAWIGADMNVIALAGAGFSTAIITHIFHAEKFDPVSRRCLLLSFIGYVLVLLILIVEIGRWDNFWTPFVSPGIHSPMFEVYMCIVAYLILQVIELIEVGAEKVAPKLKKKMAPIMQIVFIAACTVPLGHQASLGSLYLAMPAKLDPIWATQMMPWLFVLSAFFVGPCVAIVEYIWTNSRYNMKIDTEMLYGLARISAVLMGVFFVLKSADLVMRGQLGNVFAFNGVSNMFLLEMLLVSVVPIIIHLTPFGRTKGGLLTFGIVGMIGLILTCLNVVFTGMSAHVASLGSSYFPSFMEIVSTVGLFFVAFLAYMWVTENFPFFFGVAGDADKEVANESESGYNQAVL